MKPKLRRSKIAEVVVSRGPVSVDALAIEFAVSAETIRRDLGRLAETGVIQKVHGGAKPLRLHAEGSFDERMATDSAAKELIAEKLAAMIEPGDTLFIDTGSTTLIAANALARIEGLTVITNSVRIAQVLGHAPGHRTFLLGGAYHGDNGETAGPLVIDQIARFQADHAVLGVAAIDHTVGAMNADFDEAQVARAMLAHARQSVVLANAAKLGLKAAFRICAMDEIDVLICDQPPGRDYDNALRNPQLVLS